MPISRTARWGIIALLLAITGAFVCIAPRLVARALRARSVEIMEQAAGPRSRITIGRVQLDLTQGNITWSDLHIEQQVDSGDTSWAYNRQVLLAGSIGSIRADGLSIWSLLFRKTIGMEKLVIDSPQLEILAVGKRESNRPNLRKGTNELVRNIRVGSLALNNGSVAWRNVRSGQPGAIIRHIAATAEGIQVEMPFGKVPFTLNFAQGSLELEGAEVGLPPLYDLHIGYLRLTHPDSLLLVKDIELAARYSTQDYAGVVKYETDLTTFHTEAIGLRGLDISARLAQGSVRAGEARISGTDLHDYLDKTMPDAPYRKKPLPARLLRQLPFTVCIDSVVVDRLNVEYNEKDTITTDYGQIEFSDINAVAHGICNLHPDKKPEMHVVATARAYRVAPIHFDFRTAIFDSSDRFSVEARIGALPFRAFNAMTHNLLLVRATAGTIGGIDFRFDASDKQGSGRVDVEYAGLKLKMGNRGGMKLRYEVETFLANQVLRSKNIHAGGSFRHGDFTVERAQNRQIFNYMWRGLREGLTESVLPKALNDARKALKTSAGTAHRK